jgi:hypothetical protein
LPQAARSPVGPTRVFQCAANATLLALVHATSCPKSSVSLTRGWVKRRLPYSLPPGRSCFRQSIQSPCAPHGCRCRCRQSRNSSGRCRPKRRIRCRWIPQQSGGKVLPTIAVSLQPKAAQSLRPRR